LDFECAMILISFIVLLGVIMVCFIYSEVCDYLEIRKAKRISDPDNYLDQKEKIVGVNSKDAVIIVLGNDGIRKIGLDENKVRFNVEFDKLEDLKGMYFYSSSENHYIEAKIEKE